ACPSCMTCPSSIARFSVGSSTRGGSKTGDGCFMETTCVVYSLHAGKRSVVITMSENLTAPFMHYAPGAGRRSRRPGKTVGAFPRADHSTGRLVLGEYRNDKPTSPGSGL